MKRKTFGFLILSLILIQSSYPISAKTLLNETVTVNRLFHREYSFEVASEGMKIKFSIDATSEDIIIGIVWCCWCPSWICDEELIYFVNYGSISGDYAIDLGPEGTYYVVLDNTESFFAAKVKFAITTWTTGEIVGISFGTFLGSVVITTLVYQFVTRKKINQSKDNKLL